MTKPNPHRILETATAFMPAKTLLAAAKLDLFSTLSDKAMTGAALTDALSLHARANPDFYDALVALKFLERDGDGESARYRNTPETSAFLDKKSPTYIGGFLEMANDRLYPFWSDLIPALNTGEPQNEVKHTGKPLFEAIYADAERLEQFIDAMSGIATGGFQGLADKFPFADYKTLCDVGGAGGALSRTVAARHPHIKCVSADLPAVTAIAKKKIKAAGFDGRIEAVDLDFFADRIPPADVITMGNILHDWNLETKRMLIAKAFDALPPGGVFIAIESIIDDARREGVFGLMMSLNMLIETGDGFDYTGADFAGWCRDAGFSRTEILPVAGPTSAAVAYK